VVRLSSQDLLWIARDVAFELALPWRVEDLWRVGEDHTTAKPPPGNLGLPASEADESTLQSIRVHRHVEKAGKGMDRLRPDQSEPIDGQIRVALRTFTAGQWQDLIDRFDQGDIDVLLSYLEANKSPLQNWFGAETFFSIYSRAMQRHLMLRWSQPGMRFVYLTDALEAARIHKGARRRNIEKAPKPPGQQRSWDEMSRPNFIAEKLNAHKREPEVTPYKARKILGRMKQTPPQDFDGSVQDYLMWATDPEAYERDLSARSGSVPRRNPDPSFFPDN
jgi:hypothetical protein